MKDFLIVVVVMAQTFGINGFSSYCTTNQTMFIPKGHAATFVFKMTDKYGRTYFTKRSSSSRFLLSIMSRGFSLDKDGIQVDFYDKTFENRTDVSGNFSEPYRYDITIQIRQTELDDNGTYETLLSRERDCWILFVIDIRQQPVGYIAENEAVRIIVQPAASLMIRPIVNATMLWLFDGWPINRTELFLVQDGSLWTGRLPRKFNGKNVTYRALQDNGQMVEVNITLEISYGPDWPLILEPEKSYYLINNGDKMPDILCQADCNPSCAISWGQPSSDHILRLNQVSASTAGEYTCTATNDNGTTRVVTRTIFVNVLDNNAQIAAFAVLATVQTLTTAFLGVMCICYCIRSGNLPCKQCAENKLFKGKETNENQFPPNANENREVELQGYEDLDLGSSITNHYSTPTTAAGQHVPRMEVYENTRISQSD